VPVPAEDREPCPYCAELIIRAARVCRFCDRELPADWAPPRKRATIDRYTIAGIGLLVLVFATVGILTKSPAPEAPATQPKSSPAVAAASSPAPNPCERVTDPRMRQQCDAEFHEPRAAQSKPAPAVASAPTRESRPPVFDVARQAYLAKDAVICSEMALLGAYLDGHRAGGEAAGHRAVADLFAHPRGECLRTLGRDRVRVLDATVSANKLVKIEWQRGMHSFMALPEDLEN
jgi:hypothetical protein